MKQHKVRKKGTWILAAGVILGIALLVLQDIAAVPPGAVLTYVRNSSGSGYQPSNRTDPGGYIYFTNVNTIQQDANWKAYVGNVTGSYTLDDADNKTIYDWQMTVTGGEVIASRASSLTWANLSCVSAANFTTENTFFGFNTRAADNINGTFNITVHKNVTIGTLTIENSTCRSTQLYENDSRQTITEDTRWQEVLLNDGTNTAYVSLIEDNHYGFDNGQTFDFQILLPENGTAATKTTFYFWAEIE